MCTAPSRRCCELPSGQIRVIATPVGGGFGGKTDPFSHEIVASKLSMLAGHPVKITLSREDVFYAHRGRHPVVMWVRTGFERDGKITAMHFKTFLDGGAYGSYGVATLYYTGALQTSTYAIPNYRFEGVRVFTNKPACGPKRGHGTPQPRFALECQLDKAAEDLGLDPAAIRLVNARRAEFDDGSTTSASRAVRSRSASIEGRGGIRILAPNTDNSRRAAVWESPSAPTCPGQGFRSTGMTCRNPRCRSR